MLRPLTVVKRCIVGAGILPFSVFAKDNQLVALVASATGIEKMFLFMALPATLLFLIMAVITFAGVGGDSDGSHGVGQDADSYSDSLHVFTIRNFIVFFMMFGWTGLAMLRSGGGSVLSVTVGTVAGIVMIFIVSYLFFIVAKLAHSGNIPTKSAVGSTGTVYLTIPEKRSGSGKVTVIIDGSKIELSAMTDGAAIATGECVTITSVTGSDIVIVGKI